MKIARWLTDFLLYSNLFVGLCATFFVLSYYSLDKSVPVDMTYLWIVFLSTVSVYSFHRWYSFSPEKSEIFNIRNENIRKIRPFLLLWALLTGFLAGILFFFFGNYKILPALIPVILSILYLVPFYKSKRLRDFSYIKIYIVSTVWAWVAVIFPSYYSLWDFWDKLWLFLAQFLLIFGLILPLDYRDRLKDSSTFMKSYAHKLPLSKLKLLGVGCFALSLLFFFLLVLRDTVSFYFGVGVIIINLLAIRLTHKYTGEEPDYFYSGYIDGILLLQGALLFSISSFISL